MADNLRHLDVGQNDGLTGTVSSEIGNLENIEFLSLRSTRLSGQIPDEIGRSRSTRNVFNAKELDSRAAFHPVSFNFPT